MAKSKLKVAKSKGSVSNQQTKILQSGLDVTELERLLRLMDLHKVTEFEWSSDQNKLVLKTSQSYGVHSVPTVHSAQTNAPVPPAPVLAPVSAPVEAPKINSNHKIVHSPFVGTFYRAPNPNSEPYVKEGQSIKKGDTLCIIEAMKLMNQIESEWEGKVVKVLVENGQPVEYSEPLFEIAL